MKKLILLSSIFCFSLGAFAQSYYIDKNDKLVLEMETTVSDGTTHVKFDKPFSGAIVEGEAVAVNILHDKQVEISEVTTEGFVINVDNGGKDFTFTYTAAATYIDVERDGHPDKLAFKPERK